MLTKAKQFLTNPVYLLAVIVSLAVVGVGSFFAVQAFADGEVTTVPDNLITGDDRHYDTATINYLFLRAMIATLCRSTVPNREPRRKR